jgi:hypothetical protein
MMIINRNILNRTKKKYNLDHVDIPIEKRNVLFYKDHLLHGDNIINV